MGIVERAVLQGIRKLFNPEDLKFSTSSTREMIQALSTVNSVPYAVHVIVACIVVG